MRRNAWRVAVVVCGWCLAAWVRAAEPLPLEAFANLPQVEQVALSPDGQRYAALVNIGETTILTTRPLDGSAPSKALLGTDNRKFRFSWLRWVNDERLLVSVAYPGRRGWVEVAETRLFSISREGGEPLNLVRRSAFDDPNRPAQFQDQVIDWLPEDGHHVLLQIAGDGGSTPSVYRVNVETGRRVAVHGDRAEVQQWMTDATHRVRVGIRQREAQVDVLVCDPDGSRWRTAWQFGLFDRAAVHPLGFGADANRLYVEADHEGRRAVFEVDISDPALPRRLLLSHPRFDISGELMIVPKTHAAIGILGGLSNDASAGFWDDEYKALMRGIDKVLPDRNNTVLQLSADGTRYLLHSIGNGVPGQYLVGFRDRGTLALLAETYPALAQQTLARKRSLSIVARDGTVLPALLTLPSGSESKGLPTVLLPHGGPISMDSTDFDPWVQFLADRGYAVLQVNFRGSSGFGHAHMNAGLKRWGLEMQDDLSDAVKWLTGSGLADPARVCIVGASYGGYAALMGAAKTPELYRCVVSFAGVSDLLELAAHERGFENGEAVFARQVGSSWDDRAQLKATSPRRLADQIKAPVLLIHGTLDRSVPFEQSEDMASALKRAGKPHRFVRQEEGDHHLSNQAHRTQFFKELESFLAQHLR